MTFKGWGVDGGWTPLPTRQEWHFALSSRALSCTNLICIIKWKLEFAGVLHFIKRQYPEEWLKVVSREGYDEFQSLMKDENFLCHLTAWKKILP